VFPNQTEKTFFSFSLILFCFYEATSGSAFMNFKIFRTEANKTTNIAFNASRFFGHVMQGHVSHGIALLGRAVGAHFTAVRLFRGTPVAIQVDLVHPT
jgi:hypothetical protein